MNTISGDRPRHGTRRRLASLLVAATAVATAATLAPAQPASALASQKFGTVATIFYLPDQPIFGVEDAGHDATMSTARFYAWSVWPDAAPGGAPQKVVMDFHLQKMDQTAVEDGTQWQTLETKTLVKQAPVSGVSNQVSFATRHEVPAGVQRGGSLYRVTIDVKWVNTATGKVIGFAALETNKAKEVACSDAATKYEGCQVNARFYPDWSDVYTYVRLN